MLVHGDIPLCLLQGIFGRRDLGLLVLWADRDITGNCYPSLAVGVGRGGKAGEQAWEGKEGLDSRAQCLHAQPC